MYFNLRNQYQEKDYSNIAVILSLVAVTQFVFLTLVAGLFYPGGYSLIGNYFSDLGMVHVRGVLNSTSSVIFMFSVFLIVILLLPYWFLLKFIFSESKLENLISINGLVMGIISSLSLFIVALNPVDTHTKTHVFYALIFFLSFALSIFFFSLNFVAYKQFLPILYAIGLIILISFLVFEQTLAKIAYIFPFWEKLVGYLYFVWILVVDFILWKKHH